MKAIEYYDKYKDALLTSNPDEFINSANELMSELWDEMQNLIDKRNVKKNDSLIAIVKEINQKYNSIISRFDKDGKKSPLKRNAFNHLVIKRVPEFANRLIDIQ